MATITGKRLPLPLPRLWIADLLHASHQVPIITVERQINLAEVVAARRALASPPPWVMLITKAYALVAARRPELRQAYMPFPWPHLFQADESIASIAVEREYLGQSAVFFGYVRRPDQQSLGQLMMHLQRWKNAPIENIRTFSRLIRYSRWPRPIRRLAWWYAANISKSARLRFFGTFGISVTASEGATALNLISPLSTSLNYGTFTSDHTLPIRLHFDHRVLDGAPAARALQDLEEILHQQILPELLQMQASVPQPGASLALYRCAG